MIDYSFVLEPTSLFLKFCFRLTIFTDIFFSYANYQIKLIIYHTFIKLKEGIDF